MTTALRPLTLALLAIPPLLLTECRKTEDAPPAPKVSEREKFLTAANWVNDAVIEERITATGAVTTTNIPLSAFSPCSLDDTYHYRADRTFLLDDGALACPQFAPVSGTWEFASNETELLVKRGSTTDRYPIRRLTATTLSYAFNNQTQPDGSQVNLILTCVAK